MLEILRVVKKGPSPNGRKFLVRGERQTLESQNWQEVLRSARRVVIKLGTGTVSDDSGGVSYARLEPIVSAVANLRQEGRQVVLVSSGAVGMGAGQLKLPIERLNDVVTKQACAAVGQSLLMHSWQQLFARFDIRVAQVLLTEDDFKQWNRYQNLRQTMERLLKLDVVPVVNENDAVSAAELESIGDEGQRVFSDNDRLASLVMSKLDAEVLLILTNVDGLYLQPPGANAVERGQPVPLVNEITRELIDSASGAGPRGRGGMVTKLEAARIAMRSGICVVANGGHSDTIDRVFQGLPVGTVFVSAGRMAGKRRWIAFATDVRGRIIVNPGARKAVIGGKASLLASGVTAVPEKFDVRDVVSIVDEEGHEFARGIVNCNSVEAARMMNSGDEKPRRAREHVLISRENIVVYEHAD